MCTACLKFGVPATALGSLEYTDTGLAPNTSYSYQALAVDAGGTILAESAIVTVTTPAESAPEGLNLTLLAHSTSIDVSWPLVNQANSYQVFLNGNYHGSTSSWSYAITGLATSVTYT